jgi:hypothetical protein
MTQTWWLSFVDGSRPKGQQFLGVAIVDVDEADAVAGTLKANEMRSAHGLPTIADATVGWMTAAITKSHLTGCNPGGAVQASRIDDAPLFAQKVTATIPRHQLLSKADLEAHGLLE